MNRQPVLVAILCAGFACMGFLSEATSANLLRNPSFEQTPCVTPCNQSQAVMPSDWLILHVTPDTYSNDGSYGLPPSAFGNFTGAIAQDGIRWVAGWSHTAFLEIFGQVLTSPLEPGQKYLLSAYLREAVREDLAHPGTYQIELWETTDFVTADKIVVGSFQPLIANQSAWEHRTLAFTAPAEATTYPVLAFRPLGSDTGTAYPGLDNVVLVEVIADATPPVITISAIPETLWPPNGWLVPVTLSGTMTDHEPDASGMNLSTAAYAVTDEYGQVQPQGPVTPGADGSYSFTIVLQASRNEDDQDGRQYIIIVSAQDHAGNNGTASTFVTVPHDQGQ